MSEMEIIHISYAKVYQFEHITFEYHYWCGSAFLRRKDHETKENWKRPARDWAALNRWCNLSEEQQKQYLIN